MSLSTQMDVFISFLNTSICESAKEIWGDADISNRLVIEHEVPMPGRHAREAPYNITLLIFPKNQFEAKPVKVEASIDVLTLSNPKKAKTSYKIVADLMAAGLLSEVAKMGDAIRYDNIMPVYDRRTYAYDTKRVFVTCRLG